MKKRTEDKDRPADASQYPCICAAIRKAGRVVTRQYEGYLKPSGLKITQFSMLANISRNPDVTVSKLAELLLMDQTTVTRDLGVLERSGYIRMTPGIKDRRVKKIQLTETGMTKVNEARPLWEEAQKELERTLGAASIDGLLDSVRKLIE